MHLAASVARYCGNDAPYNQGRRLHTNVCLSSIDRQSRDEQGPRQSLIEARRIFACHGSGKISDEVTASVPRKLAIVLHCKSVGASGRKQRVSTLDGLPSEPCINTYLRSVDHDFDCLA